MDDEIKVGSDLRVVPRQLKGEGRRTILLEGRPGEVRL